MILCICVTALTWLCVHQEVKQVVEHYAAGEGQGEEAPKVLAKPLLHLCVNYITAGTLHAMT